MTVENSSAPGAESVPPTGDSTPTTPLGTGASPSPWNGHKFAVSLAFDDAYPEHLSFVCPALENSGFRATFYVGTPGLMEMAGDWKLASSRGHEVGCHTTTHPGPRNNKFSQVALEETTEDDMEWEILTSSDIIQHITGKCPQTFAYPYYAHYLGEGETASSYYPLICRSFLAARMFRSSDTNHFERCNLHTLSSFPMDGITFAHYQQMVAKAELEGGWLILDGHRIGEAIGKESTNIDVFLQIVADLKTRDAWVAPIAEIAGEIYSERIQAQANRALFGSTLAI